MPIFRCLLVMVASFARVAFCSAAEDSSEVVDRLLAEESGRAPMLARADDETLLRRISLDVIGELPAVDQITAFTNDTRPDKQRRLIDRLLADQRYGQNWGRYWRDVILYRRTDDRSLLGAGPAGRYFAGELNAGRPWPRIATDLITATGTVQNDGSTILVFAHLGNGVEISSEVSRIFLGVQISCAQCHDHPTDNWKRTQFHQLAAFFPRVSVRPQKGPGRRTFQVVSNEDGRATGFGVKNQPEHYMPDLERPEQPGRLMSPRFFLTGDELPMGQTDLERRAALASWVVEHPLFARAFVNRMWTELTGHGFYDAVDELGPSRSVSMPQTLEFLVRRFGEEGYDAKWLLRTILNTRYYQRRLAGEELQRLRADQLYSALQSALGRREADGERSMRVAQGVRKLAESPKFRFMQLFGFDPSLPRAEIGAGAPQALLLMNEESLQAAISAGSPDTVLGRLLAAGLDDDQIVSRLYLGTLARLPDDEEAKFCLDYVRAGTRQDRLEDLLWMLINSPEFLYRR